MLNEERGSAPAEFTMMAALLMVLFLAVLQFAGMIHARNMLTDAASVGARYGALADRTAEDGLERTQELINSSVAGGIAQNLSYEYREVPEGQVLTITVTAQIPVLVMLGGVGTVEVTGSAYDFN